MPGAVWVGEQGHIPMDRYDIVCLHTIVGRAPAHAAHFSVAGNGRIFQSRDTRFRSAANLNGNHRIIAVENEDMGDAFPRWNTNDGHAVPGFTDAQIQSNAEILAWAHEEHGVPLQLCPNSLPTSRGLAYHRQGIDGAFGPFDFPGRVSGGEVWTEHQGKVCPGDRRIAARPTILDLAKGHRGEEDDMTPEQAKTLEQAAANAKRAARDADRAVRRGQINTRLLRAIQTGDDSHTAEILAAIDELDNEEATS